MRPHSQLLSRAARVLINTELEKGKMCNIYIVFAVKAIQPGRGRKAASTLGSLVLANAELTITICSDHPLL